MRRSRFTRLLALACLGAAALPASLAARRSATHAGGTTIAVTAGKPRELSFTLSRKSVPGGTVVFHVANKGKLPHSFRICTHAAASAKANTCSGPGTKTLRPGATAVLTAHLTAKGKYEYLSTVAGQAAGGMKGLFAVTAKPSSGPGPAPVTTTPAAGGSGATCTNPQASTITVQEGDSAFTISQSSFHCGTITFSMTNTGTFQHNFDIVGVANGAGVGPVLNAGQSATMTVTLAPKQYTVQSDVGDQAAQGLQTSLTVANG